MSDRFRDIIEPYALATQGRMFEGKVPLAELSRLVPLVRSSEGEITFKLSFDQDEAGSPRVGGMVQVDLLLQCQRCMEEMELPVSSKVHLGIVPSREAAEQLPDNVDPLVVKGEETTVISILEDELILALPLVPMHELESCPQADAFIHDGAEEGQDNGEIPKRKNPFAVLAQLKETQSKDSTE